MIIGLHLILMVASSQTEALFTGGVPANVPTYEVRIRDQEPFFAGIRVNGNWVTDHSADFSANQDVECVHDSPFHQGHIERTSPRRAEFKYEAPAMRRARLSALWEENGYTFVETASGWMPVREEDITLAQRARELVNTTTETQSLPATANIETTPTPKGRLSPSALWTGRIIVTGTGIVTLVLLILFMRRNKGNWTALE